MAGTVKKFMLSTSLAAGMITISGTSVFAASLTNATVAGSDYSLYDSNGTSTFIQPSAKLSTILGGNSSSPGGNVELFSSSERLSNGEFAQYAGVSSLTGTIGGKDIILSSLTAADWDSKVGGVTLAKRWFNEALSANGLGSLVGTREGGTLYNSFIVNGGRQRFSDPNISYLNQDDITGKIKIGLAGHYDAKSLLLGVIPASLESLLSNTTVQASEIVKVTYNGETHYLYNFRATNSGLFALDDGFSHNGNYELLLAGVSPARVPEPCAILSLIGLGGLLATKRTMKNV